MRFFAAHAPPGLLLLAFLLQGSCSFDSTRLEERACGPAAPCEKGSVCCLGYCVLSASCPDLGADMYFIRPEGGPDLIDLSRDKDADGKVNEEDNCPDDYNPSQSDADRDYVGDVCDCAPYDQMFSTTLVRYDSFVDPVPFLPVDDPDSWRLLGSAYLQENKNGVHRSAHALQSHQGFITSSLIHITDGGDDSLTIPATNLSMAGTMVRTAGMAKGAGRGYYCGIDLAGSQLLIAKTAVGDLGMGQLTVLEGRTITDGISTLHTYRVSFRAEGTELKCTAVVADDRMVEISVQDSDFAEGGVALFTIGAAAYFEAVKVCAHQ